MQAARDARGQTARRYAAARSERTNAASDAHLRQYAFDGNQHAARYVVNAALLNVKTMKDAPQFLVTGRSVFTLWAAISA